MNFKKGITPKKPPKIEQFGCWNFNLFVFSHIRNVVEKSGKNRFFFLFKLFVLYVKSRMAGLYNCGTI